jgi:hypothetical protein
MMWLRVAPPEVLGPVGSTTSASQGSVPLSAAPTRAAADMWSSSSAAAFRKSTRPSGATTRIGVFTASSAARASKPAERTGRRPVVMPTAVPSVS